LPLAKLETRRAEVQSVWVKRFNLLYRSVYFQKEFGSMKMCGMANMLKRSLLANLQTWRS